MKKGEIEMLQKMDMLIETGKLKAKRALRSFMQDERGLSGVVVAVLLILVAVLAVVLLWDYLGRWIEDMWNTITEKGNSLG